MKFYLDINDRVCFSLVNDNNYIVLYEEYDFSNDMLNLLYSYLKSFSVSEMIVIAHGIVSEQVLGNAGILSSVKLYDNKQIYSQIPIADIEKIAHLAKVTEVGKVTFVDRLGYYATFNDSRCYIEDENGLYSLIVVKDGDIIGYNRCSSTVKTVAQAVCRKTGIDLCVDAYNLSNFDLLMPAFQNVHCVSDLHALYELSLFAYASSDFALKYSSDLQELFDSHDTIKEAVLSETGIENILEEDSIPESEQIVEGKPKVKKNLKAVEKEKIKKFSAPEIRRKKTAFDYVCITFTVILLIVTAGSAYANYAAASTSVKHKSALEKLMDETASLNNELEKYQYYKEFGTLNPTNKIIYDYMLNSAEFDGDIISVDSNSNKTEVIFTCKTEASLNSLIADMRNIDNGSAVTVYNQGDLYNANDIEYLDKEEGAKNVTENSVMFAEGQSYMLSFSL